jgi:hypothetical protein
MKLNKAPDILSVIGRRLGNPYSGDPLIEECRFAVAEQARFPRLAADYLEHGPTRRESTHPDQPRDFLYIHAIELYLKAFLRLQGLTLNKLKKISHDVPKLARQAFKYGAVLDTDGSRVLELLTHANVFGARYIVTGAYRRPTSIGLQITAEQLHKIVRTALRDKGAALR